MTEKLALSGAAIKITGDTVLKFATTAERQKRLHNQADYMELLGLDVCPRVFTKKNTGYTMERCRSFPEVSERVTADQITGIAIAIYEKLNKHVWSRPAPWPTALDWSEKLRTNLTATMSHFPGVITKTQRAQVHELLDWLEKQPMPEVLIHGDPTVDNVLLRHDEMPLVTDPLPPDARIPFHAVVDVGKLLQSAYGWEWRKYGKDVYDKPNTRLMSSIICTNLGSDATTAAHIWAVIHLIRILPYAGLDERLKTGLKAMLKDAIKDARDA